MMSSLFTFEPVMELKPDVMKLTANVIEERHECFSGGFSVVVDVDQLNSVEHESQSDGEAERTFMRLRPSEGIARIIAVREGFFGHAEHFTEVSVCSFAVHVIPVVAVAESLQAVGNEIAVAVKDIERL